MTATQTPALTLVKSTTTTTYSAVGDTIRKATLARFARSFSLSLSSGLPVIQVRQVPA